MRAPYTSGCPWLLTSPDAYSSVYSRAGRELVPSMAAGMMKDHNSAPVSTSTQWS